jgi:flagellum-specific peptidoglycan hydrolase FlgJ
MVPAAQASQKQYGVPASVTLAQCILESGWGTTKLSLQANNFFGIKAEHRNDPNTYVEFQTAEYVKGAKVMIEADFEKYPSVEASFTDHARLLATSCRYAPAMGCRTNPQLFSHQLQTCGYSTSPTYGASLYSLITDYKLTQYDNA